MLVSVVLTTYKDKEFINNAIRSLQTQTYEEIEIIIIDGGHTEDLERLCENDSDIRYIHQRPSGVSAARNRGIKVASGEVITFLDADDYYAPQKIQKQVETLRKGYDVTYTDVYRLNDQDIVRHNSIPVTDKKNHYKDFLVSDPHSPETIAARSYCFEDIKFSEDLRTYEDYHICVRLFKEFTPAHINEPLVFKYEHTGSLSTEHRQMYNDKISAIDDLVERFPELETYEKTCKAQAEYSFGLSLLKRSKNIEACEHLYTSLRLDWTENFLKTLILIFISIIPFYNKEITELLIDVSNKI